jgi:hypothetical protein
VNRIFYSWSGIVRRLIHILGIQEKRESWPAFLLRLIVVTFIYIKLSIFQRHHAQQRVFPSLHDSPRKLRGHHPANVPAGSASAGRRHHVPVPLESAVNEESVRQE